MDPAARPGVDPVLPVLIGGFMAAGSFFSFGVASPTLLQEGPSGDMAGAAGALTMILAGGGGFVSSAIATAVARGRGRGAPQRILYRCGLSLLAGGVIGVSGTSDSDLVISLAWFCLLGAPAVIAWFWRTPPQPSGTGEPPGSV